jgi:TPP-dependent pyruvate/acetoin dehydrogenase alpha subunit
LLKKKVATETELDALDDKAQAETDKSVEFAEASPEPGMDELFKDVYAD